MTEALAILATALAAAIAQLIREALDRRERRAGRRRTRIEDNRRWDAELQAVRDEADRRHAARAAAELDDDVGQGGGDRCA